MINGEGSDETSSEAALPAAIGHFRPWNSEISYNGDESPVSSRYSSCGESEFERYCSANSVMGTPSLCGSVGTFQECADSEFGSAKSFALSDVGSLESFNLGGGFIRKSGERKMSSSAGSVSLFDEKTTTSEGMNSSDMINDTARQGSMEASCKCNPNTNTDSLSDYESDHPGVRENLFSVVERESMLPGPLNKELCHVQDGSGTVLQRDYSESAGPINCSQRLSQSNYVEADMETTSSFGVNSDPYNLSPVKAQVQSEANIRPFSNYLDELHGQTDEESDRREGLNFSDEDKASSRFDYSEGEDSMFGGGTDDEKIVGTSHLRNMHNHQEARGQTENSFLLNSSVAFGSDDWVDWECNMTAVVPEEVEAENLPLNSPFESEVFSGNRSKQGVAIETPLDSNQLQDVYELGECSGNASLSPIDSLDSCEAELGQDTEDIFGTTNHVEYLSRLDGHKLCTGNELSPEAVLNGGSDFMGNSLREDGPALCTQKIINQDSERIESEKLRLKFDTPSDVRTSQLSSTSNIAPENRMAYFLRESGSSLLNNETSVKGCPGESHASLTPYKEHADAVKLENLELHEFYNEVVHDMEEILLDSTESPGARFKPDAANQFHFHLPLRDGGSTASTSPSADSYDVRQRSLTVDEVEVVGAKQKKGDVSFSERLVGVKKYTVYVIRVCSGKDKWEVERRYRDFCTLHRRLKTFFADKGWVLPSPWSLVEKESRKIFGSAAPDVVAERSTLIQVCLQSLLHSRFSSNLPSALIWFLGPPKFHPSSASITQNPQSPSSSRHSDADNVSTFGQTVSLVVELRPYKSMKQIQEAQQYTCAGCHKHFDDGKTRMVEFVQTLGWGKPRLCEYSGQLFCSSCHTNETAVLPARVLHHWDFTQYPVSQLAKSYLDSIYDQPMLCVSAVNPFLFSKVPALLQVMNVRKRIGTMLPFVRCPFRMSIHKGLASRRYLLESNDFFALKDLIDLSKGAFAALPAVIDAVSTRITEHITEQCLVCCDVGVPCNARQACNDPSSLIFPFQDGEIDRCRSCNSVFHKRCFKKIGGCPCQEPLNQGRVRDGSSATSQEVYGQLSGSWDLFRRKSETKSTIGFLSGLFTTKARQEGPSSPIQGDNVILMGSLPSTSL